MLRHLLKDLPLVEQRPHHPVEVVVLLVLGLVVGVLPGEIMKNCFSSLTHFRALSAWLW